MPGRQIKLILAALILGCLLWGLLPAPTAQASVGCPKTTVLADSIVKTCWECLFPMSIGGVVIRTADQLTQPPVTGQTSMFCWCCAEGTLNCPPSTPLGYWEPVRLVEIIREPFCFLSFGGVNVSGRSSIEGRGSVSTQGDPEQDYTFWQVHYIQFPYFGIMGFIVEAFCQWTGIADRIDVLYMSELDPLWDDDVASNVTAPEAALIANPIAVAACSADAIAATAGWPIDAMWWCAGSWGTLYPQTGNMAGAQGGRVKSSALAMGRLLARLARMGTEWYTAGTGHLICYDYPTFVIVKSQYKFQLLWPIANTAMPGLPCCSPLGRTEMLWGMGKTIPGFGEDFVYLLWKNQNCCLRLALPGG
jgi:conjugal transfer pilus assembly protein TraU